jgi:hypothetical protein
MPVDGFPLMPADLDRGPRPDRDRVEPSDRSPRVALTGIREAMPGQLGVADIDFGGVVVTRKRRLARGVGALRAVGGRRMIHGSTSLSPWFFGAGAVSHRAPSVSALPCSPAGHGAPSSSSSTSVKSPDFFLAFASSPSHGPVGFHRARSGKSAGDGRNIQGDLRRSIST